MGAKQSDPKTRRSIPASIGHPISPLAILVGLTLLGLYPLSLQPSNFNSLSLYAIYFAWITLAESWNLMGGYAGLLNLGLVGFFALGSVVGAVSLTSGFSFAASLGLAGAAGAIVGLALVPTFRLRGFYFAIATLVVPLMLKPIVELVAGRSDFGVPLGAVLDSTSLYYVGLAMSGLAIFGIHLLMRTKVGLALRALGEDELASQSIGINGLLFKTVALVIGGTIASVAGDYYLQILGTVNTTLFTNLNFSLYPIFMVIIGGSATLEGPVVGAIIFGIINYKVTSSLPGSTLDTLLLSIMIIGVATFLPRGIVTSIIKLLRRRTA